MTLIKDGTGHGNVAKVDTLNRLWTNAIAEREISAASKNGDAYLFPTLYYALAIGQETPIMRVTNNKVGNNFHMNKLFVSWNGGDTNHNRGMVGVMYADMSVPSANFILAAGGNLNQSSAKTSDMDQYIWNTVGTGMTVASNGSALNTMLAAQGFTTVDIEGSIILGPGDTIAWVVTAEEAGGFGAAMSGWFVEI